MDPSRVALITRISRFAMVGLANVGVDFGIYALLIALGVSYAWAKATGFVAGTLFAFFANRAWTFGGSKSGLIWLIPFALLYTVSGAVNVMINHAIIAREGGGTLVFGAAYCAATLTSAAINFFGMQYMFQRKRTA